MTLTILALVGLILMLFIIRRVGLREVFHCLSQISPAQITVLFLLRLANWMMRTLCWQLIISANGRRFSFFSLFSARMAGHAVSQLTPASQIGSEATRLLLASSAGKKVSFCSIVIDKSLELLTVTGLAILTLPFLFHYIRLPWSLQLSLLLPVVGLFTFSLLLLVRQRKGLFTGLISLAESLRFPPAILNRYRERFSQTDELISAFYTQHRRRFLLVMGLYSGLVALWVWEVQLSLIYLKLSDVSLLESTLITLAANLIFILSFVPGSLGIYEASFIGIFSLFSRPARAALSLVIIHRVLGLLLSVFGLLAFIKPRGGTVAVNADPTEPNCLD